MKEDEDKNWVLQCTEKMSEDKEKVRRETGEENLADICLKAVCHSTDTWVGILPLLQGQRLSISTCSEVKL